MGTLSLFYKTWAVATYLSVIVLNNNVGSVVSNNVVDSAAQSLNSMTLQKLLGFLNQFVKRQIASTNPFGSLSDNLWYENELLLIKLNS